MPSFWQGRRVLLTGHTGFKGAWLALWLQRQGAAVTGLALEPQGPRDAFVAAAVADGMDSTIADVRDPDAVAQVVERSRPEVVLHLAAQALVRRSYDDPVDTFSTNVVGTATLLDQLRACDSLRAIVVATSDKCYENREWEWAYRETDALGGADPYSASKACQEHVVTAFRRSWFDAAGVGVGTVRAGNVVGGGDRSQDRLVPDVLDAFVDDRPVVLRNPGATRPWQHVLDPLSGYLRYAERLASAADEVAAAYNFGPGDQRAWTVQRVVEHLGDLWGRGGWEADSREQPHEARSLRLDASRAMADLGWRPRLSTAQALEWTVAWHAAQLDGADMRAVTEEQIASYEAADEC